jgi:hypothetical protein
MFPIYDSGADAYAIDDGEMVRYFDTMEEATRWLNNRLANPVVPKGRTWKAKRNF